MKELEPPLWFELIPWITISILLIFTLVISFTVAKEPNTKTEQTQKNTQKQVQKDVAQDQNDKEAEKKKKEDEKVECSLTNPSSVCGPIIDILGFWHQTTHFNPLGG